MGNGVMRPPPNLMCMMTGVENACALDLCSKTCINKYNREVVVLDC